MRCLCVFIILILFYSRSAAQERNDTVVSAQWQNTPLLKIFEDLESRTGFHFYYDTARLDSIRVTYSPEKDSLSVILQQVLNKTGLQFTIDRNRNVFITREVKIQSQLAQGYYRQYGQAVPPAPSVTALLPGPKKPVVAEDNKIIHIGDRNKGTSSPVILTGYIRNDRTGEPVIYASIFIEKLQRGVSTDQYGYYSITLPPGNHLLNIQSIGMKDARYQVALHSDGALDIIMKEQVPTLKNVYISYQKSRNIRSTTMGVDRLTISAIKNVPSIFGEADIIRVVTSLPGVKTVGEMGTGFNVRGGSTDQNLILFNDATIYNPSHFFGMFSAFNPEVVKDIELYKSSIPAKYGGRLSSVLAITSKEGNKKTFSGTAGIGPVTARMTVEGPIGKKERTSFIAGGRATYANWLMQLLPSQYDNSKASFHDINAILSHHFNKNNDLYFTGYYSNDRFNLTNDTVFRYSNRNISMKWKHVFNKKLVGNFTAGADEYQYTNESTRNKINAYKLDFSIRQYVMKTDFNFLVNARHNLNFGLQSIRYQMQPGTYRPNSKESMVEPDIVADEQALESSAYLEDQIRISNNLSLNAGLRYSIFNYLGPQEINYYKSGHPREEDNIVETKSFDKGSIVSYKGPEYRLSLRYSFTPTFSVKTGYNSSYQYIHMLSNTMAVAPTDIWKLSDPNIKPQQGEQISFGLYKNLKSNTIEVSGEVYYKRLKDYLDYKPGAKLVLNHHIETDVINTRGKSYGAEFLIKKSTGKLNGWLSYSWSRVLLKMDDTTQSQLVNEGRYYPASYDKPHDVTMVGNFKINQRFSVSLTLSYSTGRPVTIPIGRYYYAGSQRVLYSDRNSYRMPDYFRSDFSMNIDGNYKVKQKTHNSWTIGCYNVTGRKNPYSIYFVSEGGAVNGYKLSIFGSAIPFVNFNIHF